MEDLRGDLVKACESLAVEQNVRELAIKLLSQCMTPAGEALQTTQVLRVSHRSAEVRAPHTAAFIEHSLQADELKRLKFACLLYLSKRVRSLDPSAEPSSWGLPEVLEYFELRCAHTLDAFSFLDIL